MNCCVIWSFQTSWLVADLEEIEENECLNMQTKEEIKTMSMKD
jgi:hypothetical protein